MEITSRFSQYLNPVLRFRTGLLLVVFCFSFLSCGTSQRRIAEHKPSGSAKANAPSEPAKGASSLPSDAEVNRSALRPLVETFKSQQPQDFNALNATTVGRAYSLTMVSNCDLDVLKGFIVKGWVPIVSLRSSSRSQLWAVVGYSAADQVVLENPIDNRRRTQTKPNFMAQWEQASDGKCALITPGRLDQAQVQMALDRYLPQSKVTRVKVTRSLQGRARP